MSPTSTKFQSTGNYYVNVQWSTCHDIINCTLEDIDTTQYWLIHRKRIMKCLKYSQIKKVNTQQKHMLVFYRNNQSAILTEHVNVFFITQSLGGFRICVKSQWCVLWLLSMWWLCSASTALLHMHFCKWDTRFRDVLTFVIVFFRINTSECDIW